MAAAVFVITRDDILRSGMKTIPDLGSIGSGFNTSLNEQHSEFSGVRSLLTATQVRRAVSLRLRWTF